MSSKTYVSVTKIDPMAGTGSTSIHGPYDTDEKAIEEMVKLSKRAEERIRFYDDVEDVTVTSRKDRNCSLMSETIVASFRDEGGYAAPSTVVSYHIELLEIGNCSLREDIDDLVSDSKKAADSLRKRSEWEICTETKSAKLHELADALTEAADKIVTLLPDSPYDLVKED